MFFLRAKSAMLACVDGKQMRLEAIKNYHLRILIRTTKLLRHWIRRASMWEWASGWFKMGGYPKCPGSCCFCFAARENKYRFHPLSPGTRTRTHTHITLNGCQTKEVNGGKKKNRRGKKNTHPRLNSTPRGRISTPTHRLTTPDDADEVDSGF